MLEEPLDDARLLEEVDELGILSFAFLQKVILVEQLFDCDPLLVEESVKRRSRSEAKSPEHLGDKGSVAALQEGGRGMSLRLAAWLCDIMVTSNEIMQWKGSSRRCSPLMLIETCLEQRLWR